MKILIPLFLVFLAISCKKEESSSQESTDDFYRYMENVNKKITQNKPFFDFDEVIHYEFPISSQEYEDLILADTLPEKSKLLSIIFHNACPVTQEEKIKFKEALEAVDKEESTIKPKWHDELNSVFSEKKCDDMRVNSCAPIYRDIFIFKKNKKEIGMAKICFECQLFSISNKEAITDCFNQNGELSRLKKIISENKIN